MEWGARLRAAWRGEVPAADLNAMFAAASGLDALRQALADQRLATQIAHPQDEWRALLQMGPLAAPFWLVDTLVALAGAFYDGETQAHPDRSGTVSAYTHELVGRLLAPIEDISAELTAALTDPSRRPALREPLRLGPGGDIADLPLPEPVPESYWRALAAAARRVHTSASSALADAQVLVTRSAGPDWLEAGLRHVDGGLRAAGARLDMDEVRMPTLARAPTANPAAPGPFCRDLWLVVDTASVAGQMVADPHLLPEAAVAVHRASSPPVSGRVPTLTGSPTPRHDRTPSAALPRIPEGAPAPGARPVGRTTGQDMPPSGALQDIALPSIGPGQIQSAGTEHGSPTPTATPSLPTIGAPETLPTTPTHQDEPHSVRGRSEDRSQQDVRLPEIG